MKILDRLRRATDSRSKAVANDLARLDAAHAGLGRAAADYVLGGEDGTVLATIAAKCTGNLLEVGQSHLRNDSPARQRRKLLALLDPYDVPFACRYTEVLAAACADLPETAPGSDAVPKAVRAFFGEAFAGLQPSRSRPDLKALPEGGLVVERALEIAAALGGTRTDFIDALYDERARWGAISGARYRALIDTRALAEADPEAFAAASRRVGAKACVRLIRDLSDLGLADRSPFLDLVLEHAGHGAKAVREIAVAVLAAVPAERLEPLATARLDDGAVNLRAAVVDVLGRLGTETALAALRAHREKEKTARVVAAIDTALTVSEHAASNAAASSDDRSGYVAVDGSVIEIPPVVPLPDEAAPPFGRSDRAELVALIEAENERLRRMQEEMVRHGYKQFVATLHPSALADDAIALFNGDPLRGWDHPRTFSLQSFMRGPGSAWARKALARLPRKQALEIATRGEGTSSVAVSGYYSGPFSETLQNDLHAPDGDLRRLEALEIELGIERYPLGYGANKEKRKTRPGDFLRVMIYDGYTFLHERTELIPGPALWPYVAEHLDVIDEAFGLKPPGPMKLSRIAAIRMLARLPKPPARYFGPLLEAATGSTKAGRAEARAMLNDVPEVESRLVGLLDDARQALRAGAAEWLGERRDPSVRPALEKRLEKEKSELVRAAILTALGKLGADLSGYLGPDALLADARKAAKGADLAKLDRLGLEHLPRARYRSGEPVPSEVLRAWLALAVKLKQPGGNALFGLYLDQLDPGDAETFSTWVLDSWLNYDTARPNEADASAYARTHGPARLNTMLPWIANYTLEQAIDELKREYMSSYPNSGAATKGLLALATRAAPSVAAERVRGYLKHHGSRTSQASALLEMLAASGSPAALQVVIAAATRLKQKGVQKLAGELVAKVAEERDWSLDELADRTIPTAGLDDDGVLELVCGHDGKRYTAVIDSKLNLALRNADGKPVKALPGGQDDATKEAKKQLSAARRELKQVVAMQTARLYEALCAGRTWPVEDWRRDYAAHPIMRRLIERVVWLGLDAAGNVEGAFRPTAEGDFTASNDEAVELERFAAVKLAYGALLDEPEAQAWQTHLGDYEVEPLFTQFGRAMLEAGDALASKTAIDDRKGWVTDTFTIRGIATKLGYERGETLDGGFFNTYQKRFQSAGVTAVIEFSGNCLPEQNLPAALVSLSFERIAPQGRGGRALALRDVPKVLLSECWNDYRTMAAKGAYDEQWEKRMPW